MATRGRVIPKKALSGFKNFIVNVETRTEVRRWSTDGVRVEWNGMERSGSTSDMVFTVVLFFRCIDIIGSGIVGSKGESLGGGFHKRKQDEIGL